MDVCAEMIKEGWRREMKSAIKEKVGGKFTEEEGDFYISNFIANSRCISDEIKVITIKTSYEMGWNQRATGRVYSLLSGHGYLIGCSFGCVITYGEKVKNCTKCADAKRRGI